ncbi:unnamed protein product [Linum tenue]|uniref:Peptidyl-prolyl cis-trans isomerase CYP38-like PsbQ-like domain-containing protein n=1 Tax=Linum tenue TaxID=586396 RepID=A0AAV0GSZ9_9ROSI|nr:unnamed protein product [Linum tenue]
MAFPSIIPTSGVHRFSLFSSPSSARTTLHLLSSSNFPFRFNPIPHLHCPPAAGKRSADYRVHCSPAAKPTSQGDNCKDYNPPAVMQDMDKGLPFCVEAGMPSSQLRNKNLEGLIAMVLMFAQLSSPLPFFGWEPFPTPPANAVLYSPDTKVPRTGELALRKAIPANANMKAIQNSLEDLSYLLRIPQRKPYGTMEGNVKKALKIATEEKNSILASLPEEFRDKGSSLYASLIDGKGGLQALIKNIKDQDPDKVSVSLASSLDTIAEIELLQVCNTSSPVSSAPGLSFLLPEQYKDYPRLNGRGTVEFTIEKGDGSAFSPEAGGESRKTVKIQV